MDIPSLDGDLALIHQAARLRIMALLYKRRDVSYTATRDHLGLTDGNLATHVRRLEDAGLITSRRALQGRDGFSVRYAITPKGSAAFRDYLAALRSLLDGADAPPPDNKRPGRAEAQPS